MREPALNSSCFPTAQCESCGKTVLTHVAFDDSGTALRFCIHCDSLIESDLRWVTAEELAMEGYQIGARTAKPARGGCGSGCGSCSTRTH
jgi:hypothetical protein